MSHDPKLFQSVDGPLTLVEYINNCSLSADFYFLQANGVDQALQIKYIFFTYLYRKVANDLDPSQDLNIANLGIEIKPEAKQILDNKAERMVTFARQRYLAAGI